MIEIMLRDIGTLICPSSGWLSCVTHADILSAIAKGKDGAQWRFAILRYFNPIGAHESGLIGTPITCLACLVAPCLKLIGFRMQARIPKASRTTCFLTSLRLVWLALVMCGVY